MKWRWWCGVLIGSVLCFLAAGMIIGASITGRTIILEEESGVKHLWAITLFFVGVIGLSIACYARERGRARNR